MESQKTENENSDIKGTNFITIMPTVFPTFVSGAQKAYQVFNAHILSANRNCSVICEPLSIKEGGK